MISDKPPRQNRLREALGRVYDQHPPYFQEYLRRYKEDPTSRVFAPLAEAYRTMGRTDEALQLCREGMKHHPDFHGGRVALAKCLIDKKLWDEARGELDRVVQVVPENLLAQKLLGEVQLSLGNVDGALHCYRVALLLSPQDVALNNKVRQLERGEVPLSAIVEPTEPPAATIKAPAAAPPIEEPKVDPEVEALWEALDQEAELEESVDEDPERRSRVDAILGATEETEVTAKESFQIEHVSQIFTQEVPRKKREITTETLGDLYFAQGQFDRSLRIYERIASVRPSAEIQRKVNACRMRLGVDPETIERNRKIAALKSLLKKTQTQKDFEKDPENV